MLIRMYLRWAEKSGFSIELIVYRQHAERTHKFLRQHAGFITCCRSAQHAGGKPAVNRHALFVLFHKVGVAVGFHQPRDAAEGFSTSHKVCSMMVAVDMLVVAEVTEQICSTVNHQLPVLRYPR